MAVVDVLRAFADKRATTHEAMRALAEHDGWFVPALLVPGEHVAFDKLIAFDTEGKVPSRLWVFTDEERAHRANGHGFAMGIYGGPLRGTQVFTLFKNDWPSVDVNPASPQAETWNIGAAAYPLAAVWAQAIELERALHAGDSLALVDKLGAYADYTVAIAPDNTPVKLPIDGESFALAFTTPDWQELFLAQLSPEQRQHVRCAPVRARDLFPHLERLGVAGVILNVTAPEHARTVITRELGKLVPA